MKTRVTTMLLACLAFGSLASLSLAQEREDVIWARFTDEEITLDGELNEAAWDEAETIELTWGEYAGAPGSGWFTQALATGIDAPVDPPVGSVKVLADGDYLYFAFSVQDSSIGGGSTADAFHWNWDAIFMPFVDKTEFGPDAANPEFHHFPAADEFMITWWNNVDTTETGEPTPGILPMHRSHDDRYGVNENFSVVDSSYTEEQMENWQSAFTINGTTNDDSDGADEGYVIETRINMAPMGYDLDNANGDAVIMGLAFHDADWYWGDNSDQSSTARVWYQNQWGNFATGSIKIHTDPAVTTGSGVTPIVPPDVVIPGAGDLAAPTIDGVLDEAIWQELDTAITIQFGNEELMASWPGTTPYVSGYFKGQPDPAFPVVEPSPAHVKWFYKDNWIYFGIDVDDQAVDTTRDEAGDGLTITVNHRDTTNADNVLLVQQYTVTIGPDGEARLDRDFSKLSEGSYEVAGSLKGETTQADPSDIDEGYQLEFAFNLVESFGYPEGRGDGAFFFALHTFDTDSFEDADRNYSARTWWSRERGGGVPVWGYMDPSVTVAAEEVAELPGRIELLGNYPNPFNPSTTIKYVLPAGGDVSIHIFDVLGREVTAFKPGLQSAGRQQIELNAGFLASGIYFYRVDLEAAGAAQKSVTGQMVLVK